MAVVALRGADAPTSDRIVELPKVVVSDSRELPPPESWRYGKVAGFEVLSNASDKATQRLLRDFEMFRQALGRVWPLQQRPAPIASLILVARGAKFEAFVPGRKDQSETALASLLLQQGGRSALVIDLQATTLRVLALDTAADAASGYDSSVVSVEHDKQLYREYVRYLLGRSEPRLPAWFEEGLSQIVMKMKFDRRSIEFGRLEDPNTVSIQAAMAAEQNLAATTEDPDAAVFGAPVEDRDFAAALNRQALVPLNRFFAVTHEAPEALNPLGNNRWAKQAYAFVHMGLYGYGGKYQKPFMAFLQRAAREPVTEAMMQECFGLSYKKMLEQIRSYCDFTVYEYQEYKAKSDVLVPPPPLALRDATQAEIGRIKGEALFFGGHKDAAHTALLAPYIRGEHDADLLAALGLFERNTGDGARARKLLEAAHVGQTTRADASLELARLRYEEAVAQPAREGKFSAAQIAAVLEPLRAARRQPPRAAALYELAAEALARSSEKPKIADAEFLIEGAQQFPLRLKLVFQAAAACAQAGEFGPAHALADHGLKFAPDASGKETFAALKAALPPAPASSAPNAVPVGKK